MVRKRRIVLIIACMAIVPFSVYMLIIGVFTKPKLVVEGMALGSISQHTVKDAAITYLHRKKIKILFRDEERVYSLSDLGIFFDPDSLDGAVRDAGAALRRPHFLPQSRCCSIALPEMVVDISRLDGIFEKELDLASREPKNSKLVYRKQSKAFEVTNAVSGFSLDAVLAKDAVISAARNTKEDVSLVDMNSMSNEISPNLEESTLLKASYKATGMVNRDITIRVADESIHVTHDDIMSWLSIKTSAGAPDIVVSHAKIKEYLLRFSQKFQATPINQVVKHGQVIQAGKNGRRVVGIEAVAKTIGDELSQGLSLPITAVLTAEEVGYRSIDVTPLPQPLFQNPVTAAKYTYRILTKGTVHADITEFRNQVRETLSAGNGWPASGATFQETSSSSNLDIILTEPGILGSYAGCSAEYSCRVGRLVMINDVRWRESVSHWTLTLRDYRHMVVNHEVGHWLGLGHANCPGAGQIAPVMQQQTISLQGCVANPWPTQFDRARL